MEIASVIATIVGYFVEPIKKHCGYLIQYNSNIRNRDDQIQQLRDKRKGVESEIIAEKGNGQVILPEIESWVKDVDKFLDEYDEGNKKSQETEGWCPRYYSSRKAKKKTLEINVLLTKGQFPKLCCPPPPMGIGSSTIEGIMEFESRTEMMEEVLKALVDDEVNMIAICGMGGIGKTTMVKQVAERAKKLFHINVLAEVSQKQDLKNIQDQIADMLHLKLRKNSTEERRNQVSAGLSNSNSVLVILDDVWQKLNPVEIGIPYRGERKCCKILLTSRSEEVCTQMESDKIFTMGLLSETEAWNLFKEKAGNCIDTITAKKVAGECKGLPVAIATVGSALKNKEEIEWDFALEQLQKSISENIYDLDSEVYSRIELSYKYLKSTEAQSIFLLCCLFPEDSDIPIEYLVRYGVGQRLFDRNEKVAEARVRVLAMIKNLKRSSLLLHSDKEECVKMHDVVRDVAISIAKKDKGFLVGCNDNMEEWPKQDTYEHSAISLVSQELNNHPDGLECPKLELLQLACGKSHTKTQKFPPNMFKEMNKLKVLSMEGMSFQSPPQSIDVLENLRTLLLEYCKLEDVSAIGSLGKLEILSFLGSKVMELPGEIGNLSQLKLLDLSDCSALQKIPPGLLSSLYQLEELYMFGVDVNWEPTEGNKEGAIASLAELMSLNRFTALKVHIPNIEVLPKDLRFKNPKLKFQIFACEKGIYRELSVAGCYLFENSLALERSDASDIVESQVLLQLLKKSEILYLAQIKDLKNILYELDQEGFQCLKILRVFASEHVEYVIDATSHQTPCAAFPILESLELSDLCSLKEICHSQFPRRSFSDTQLARFHKLRSLSLLKCSCLKNVFSLSIARGLVQLQHLVINSCSDMEEIFSKEGEDENALDEIRFPQLTSVELSDLPRLIGFCPVELVQPSLNQKVRSIGNDEVTSLGKLKMTDIQQHTGSFPESTSISHKFFSSKTILWPPKLERLEFKEDLSLEEIFNLEGLKVDRAILGQLKTLKVQELPNLVYMWKNVPRGMQGFLSLTSIEVYNCGRLRYLLPPSVAKLLEKLQNIKIKACGVIQYIVQRDGEEEPEDIMLSKLTSFMLEDVPNFSSFCIHACSFRWQSIKKISLGKCLKLKTLGPEIRRPKKLKKIRTFHSIPRKPRRGSSSVRDSPGFLAQCLECVGRNYDPTVVSDRGTPKNSKESSSVNKEGTLIKLKDPRASGIDKPTEIWSLFPSHMIEYLRNLESIKLWRCDSVEVIFQLEELNAEESHVASALDQLRELDLSYLPKLKHIWMKGPERITGFGNLRFLAVWACNSLTYLLSPSIAKLLVMLEDIKVSNCEKIEEILERARKEEEEKEISFYKVKSILLKDLPKLKCFCNEVNAFEWPSLKEITVIRCPALSTFVPSDLNTPKLEGVYDQIEWDLRTMFPWKGDLNATIQHMFKGKGKQVDQETQHQDENMSSRTKMMKEVLEALRDDKLNMIAICGMGGIGKTMMAKEVAKRAKDDKLFDEIVMAVVSQNQDFRRIQFQIAEMIGLNLIEKDWIERAERLRKRLMDSKSVLVILDDVWDALDLEALGIPYGGQHNSCKILLTSRNVEACAQMQTQKIFPIKFFSQEEAWNLLREMAGNCIDTPDLHSIAKEVAKECGGLPAAIVTVGRALENKSAFLWSAALQQLKNAMPKNIPGLDSEVYSSIELTYSYILSDEAKSCFLLCSLFPEDSNIPIEHLVRYGVGQRLFAKIDTVAEARNRVHAIVKNLKRSFLLLDSEEGENFVKMHVVVRDVAISIAENHGFLVRCKEKMEEWPEKDSCERSTAISLQSKELKRHPDGLECPKLELLQLACGKSHTKTQKFPPNMFKEMNKLKVLSMEGMSFQSPPQSIDVLENLQTLLLEYCKLEDVSAIGSLGKLEILSFLGSKIMELPGEIGNLSQLKLLDLSDCSALQKIPPGLLSSLYKLEELYMFGVDVNWEPMEGNKEGAIASLAELMSLNRFTALKIHIPNIEVLPKDLRFKNPKLKFQIFACGKGIYRELSGTGCYLFENSLALERSDASDIVESQVLLQLLKKSEILYLKQIKDLKNILYELDQEGFQCLKILRVFASEHVEYVIGAAPHQTQCAAFPILESLELSDLCSLKEICHSQLPKRSFSDTQLACFRKLRSLFLLRCSCLKNVFSLSIARGLVQLQQLVINSCSDMEEIFSEEGEDENALDEIRFPQLTSVKLSVLPRLIGFCPVELVQPPLNQEVRSIGNDEVTSLEKHKMTGIQQHTGSFPESTSSSHKFFSSKTILWPPKLERLEFKEDSSLEEIFNLEGLKVDNAILGQLKTLKVQELPNLVYMWKNVPRGMQGFLSLTSIEVYNCGGLRYLLPSSVAKLLEKLQCIKIKECGVIQNIVQRDGDEEPEDIMEFPKVTSFTVEDLPNLVSFCIDAYSFRWQSMKEISLAKCPKLKTFGSEIQRPKKLKKISRALDSRPQKPGLGSSSVRDSLGFLGQCLECVGRNYDPTVVSDRGTTKNSKGSSSVNKEGTLIKLKNPGASGTDKPTEIWSLFPSRMIESLTNLESIKLWRCDSVEVIFQLEELNAEESHVASVLDQLRELDLSYLPKLNHIWMKGPERITGFGNLRFLAVRACNSLTYLFSPSIAKLLVMLEDIKVSNCEKIEEILERAGEEEEEKEISFYKVKSILLKDLPKLKCFCNEVNAFVWPSLKEITVIRCPALSTFVPSDLNTPKLEGVYNQIEWDQRTMFPWKGDLNATIQHMFEGKGKQVDQETQHQDEIMSSRTKMMKEVLEALRDDKLNVIAIRGMGGIGKTTMAKEVAKRAKDDKLFDEVVMAVVSQNKNLSKIQDEIADMLGLELKRESEAGRARQLYYRLIYKSVLVILDDVWDALDLDLVGIPYGGQHNRCKILLTSRSEDACTQMKSQKIFKIEVLSEEEAWNLFREMAGNCVDTDLRQTAEEVAKECGGLPGAIVTVGKALENKGNDEWIAALQQLKNSIPKNIRVLHSKVYSSIEFSYKYLKSDEAKSCFLLCCLFPEDYDIPIEFLVRHGVGQRLFAKIDTVAVARNRVHAIVKNLKRSSLLLDSEEGEMFVKMHDVVRDVAISIAENQGFLVRCNENMEEWPEKDSCERSTAISLVSTKLKRHPDGLECPKLELLQLASEINNWYGHPLQHTLPPNLFKGMEGLKVLTLFGMSFQTLPQSINVLQNLRTLQFVHCGIIDVSAIGELRKLEILSFTKSEIMELPGEVRNLSYLKLLDLRYCDHLERIPPDLLSNLSHLQELYMLGVDVKWKPMEDEEVDEKEEEVYEEEDEVEEEVDEEEKKGANASLAELKSLSELVAVEIDIPNIKVLPKDLTFENKKIEFQIFVGGGDIRDYSFDRPDYLFKNRLGLGSCDVRDIVESSTLLQLLKKSEILKLNKIKDLKNIVYELDNEGFRCLKVLEVVKIDDVEYVLDATSDQNPRAAFPTLESLQLRELPNLKEIYHSQFPERSFSVIHSQPVCFGKLRSIFLSDCNCLKNVFSLSIARGLVQLQKLDIRLCKDMEECFPKEGEDEEELDKITFRHLTSIEMCVLDGLIGFCTGVGPVELVQPSLNREVGRIGTDEVTNLEKHKMTNIQQHTGPFPESTPIISHKLFSSNTILWAPNLENLILEHARSLQVVFDLEGLKVDEVHKRIAVLAQLKTLKVENLNELTYVWKNVPPGIQGFQKLTSIEVGECHRLRYLFPTSIAKLLVELQSIYIRDCDAIENIVQRDGEEEATDIVLFPRVSSLTLQELPNMMNLYTKTYSFEWSSIKKICLWGCSQLKTIGSEIQSPRKSKKIDRELDSRPNDQELGSPGFVRRFLECVPRRKNDGLMVVSDQGTTNKSQRSYSVKEEGALGKPSDPEVGDSNNPSEIWSFFPSHIIECLKNLESIKLGYCYSLKFIFQLEELNVEESHMAPLLDQLRELDLYDLPILMHIWKKGPKGIVGFKNLRLLKVFYCDSLTYLFSPSIAKLLVMLEEIKVGDCINIEEILARASEEEEEKDVLFHKVNSISLINLPSLKCFCNEANALNWPSLKKIEVAHCPSLSTFIPSKLDTPKLEGVYIGGFFGYGRLKMCHWMGDLNAAIEHIFKGKEKQANHETQQEEQIETIKREVDHDMMGMTYCRKYYKVPYGRPQVSKRI